MYSRAPKSELFGFWTKNFVRLSKGLDFGCSVNQPRIVQRLSQTVLYIIFFLYLKQSSLVLRPKSKLKSSDFGQKITFEIRSRKVWLLACAKPWDFGRLLCQCLNAEWKEVLILDILSVI